MRPTVVRRSLKLASRLWMMSTLTALLFLPSMGAGAGLGTRHTDPSQVLPLDQLAYEYRESISEVIREHTFHRQGDPESFHCQGDLYLNLLNEPLVPLTLWKDLSVSPVQLTKIGPNRYQGTDGAGASAVWDFVLRTPRLHVLLAYLTYVSPRGSTRIDARIVMIVHTSYGQGNNRESLIQHDVEAYVKVDTMGWKTLRAHCPARRRARSRGSGSRGRLLCVAHEPAGGHLSQLGLPGHRQPTGDRHQHQAAIPGSRRPKSHAGCIQGTPGRRAEPNDQFGRTPAVAILNRCGVARASSPCPSVHTGKMPVPRATGWIRPRLPRSTASSGLPNRDACHDGSSPCVHGG